MKTSGVEYDFPNLQVEFARGEPYDCCRYVPLIARHRRDALGNVLNQRRLFLEGISNGKV
jgi:hypothetical protein